MRVDPLVCYGKKFGPKGYGYGQGGGALQSDCYANGWVLYKPRKRQREKDNLLQYICRFALVGKITTNQHFINCILT